jgi:hypothetical protein
MPDEIKKTSLRNCQDLSRSEPDQDRECRGEGNRTSLQLSWDLSQTDVRLAISRRIGHEPSDDGALFGSGKPGQDEKMPDEMKQN